MLRLTPSRRSADRRRWWVEMSRRGRFPSPLLLAEALGFAALHLVAGGIGPYGLFHDEPYYWACSRRLDLGYVDHPPLAPWVLAAATALLGDGWLGFRLVPALCGAATVLLSGRIAQRFGAGTFGQLLAGLCVAAMPLTLVVFSFYSVNALEYLFWTAATYGLVEVIRSGDRRGWLGIGVIAGLGLLNKHTFALLPAALAVGILATPLRAQLRTRWPWYAAAIALTLALPNVLWNALNGWPSLAFYRSRPAADLPATVLDGLGLQILTVNPVNLLVWVPGVFFLFFARRRRVYRPLAIAFLILFAVILLSGHRRADRIGGIYPVVLAAGAAFWDRRRVGARVGVAATVLVGGALMLPATLALLPPQAVARYMAAFGQKPEIEVADVGQELPQYLGGRLWAERFADQVADAWDALPPDERRRTVLLAPHWVFASPVEYYARDRPGPRVVAPHNAYWFWRHEAAGHDAVLAVGILPQALSGDFAATRELGVLRCERCIFGRELPLVLATGPLAPLEELLTKWRYFSIERAPLLVR
jgi:hypothetical protein